MLNKDNNDTIIKLIVGSCYNSKKECNHSWCWQIFNNNNLFILLFNDILNYDQCVSLL